MFLTVILQSVAVPWKWTSLAALAHRVSNTFGYALSQFFKYTYVSVCYHSICSQGLKPKGYFIFSRKCPLSRDFTNPNCYHVLYSPNQQIFLQKSKFANITINYSLKRVQILSLHFISNFVYTSKVIIAFFGKCFCKSKPTYFQEKWQSFLFFRFNNYFH